MGIWACNCPLCRVLVHPILRLLVSGQEVDNARKPSKQDVVVESVESENPDSVERGEEASLDKKSLLEESKAGGKESRGGGGGIEGGQQSGDVAQRADHGKQQQAMLNIVQNPATLPQLQEQLGQRDVKPVVPEEVRERIEKLEKELGKLRSELKEALESISEALIDVRAAVVENVNPFFTTNGGKQVLDTLGASVDVEHIVELIKALNEELDKFDMGTLVELIDSLAESGSIGEGSARVLKALVKAVSEMKRKGVSVDEQIRLITLLLNRKVKNNRS